MAAKKKHELRLGPGWSPDPVDPRDLTAGHDKVRDAMKKVGLRRLERRGRRLPPKVDLSEWAGPVYFQGGFNTCNSHVVAGLVTYFENRAFGKSVAPSRLFLYKVARNFLQTTGDAGVYIRQVMGVLKLVGVPPERYWPYPDPGTMTQPRALVAQIAALLKLPAAPGTRIAGFRPVASRHPRRGTMPPC